ncbi:MAG: DNA-binding protein [Gammaproteobacteria bacterium]|nr:MAG: DNA-binding protein [Gammaproteobacteria bacterium]
MAYDQEVRTAVRRSYVNERLALAAAAEKHKVTYATARTWKRKTKTNGDDWDKARSATRMAEGGIGEMTSQVIEDFALLFLTTIADIKKADDLDPIKKAEALSRLSDAYSKTMKAASTGSPQIARLSIAMEVLQELAVFIRKHSPDDLPRFSAILDPFGQHITKVMA